MNTLFYQWINEQFPKGSKGFKVNAANAAVWIESLTKGLPDFVPRSTGLVGGGFKSRREGFKLGDYSHGKHEVSRSEDLAQIGILQLYRDKEFCGTERSAFLTSIHSYQVPVAAKQGDKRGKVDLLGTTNEGLPAVVELKCLGDTTNRSVGGLLGPIIQGLAYALTIRHYWASPSCEFKKEWHELEPDYFLPETLEDRTTPIIVAANRNFWESSSTWSKCPWSLFKNLAMALAKVNLPLYAALFESADRPDLEFVRFETLIEPEGKANRLGWPVINFNGPEPR